MKTSKIFEVTVPVTLQIKRKIEAKSKKAAQEIAKILEFKPFRPEQWNEYTVIAPLYTSIDIEDPNFDKMKITLLKKEE